MFKALFIGHLFRMRSERQLVREIGEYHLSLVLTAEADLSGASRLGQCPLIIRQIALSQTCLLLKRTLESITQRFGILFVNTAEVGSAFGIPKRPNWCFIGSHILTWVCAGIEAI